MSRIGKLPVELPDNVDVKYDGSNLTIKGPKGELTREVHNAIELDINDEAITVSRTGDSKDDRALHGMTRSLIEGMVTGVVEGYKKQLELVGVGYSAALQGNSLKIEVGYSHPVQVDPPENIEFNVEKNKITVSGIDKQQVGNVAAQIRSLREPEPYKGKGIKYIDERIRRKEGKTG
ncbi:MAG: 50S ribosomal protein L6 [Bacillota bacterium]